VIKLERLFYFILFSSLSSNAYKKKAPSQQTYRDANSGLPPEFPNDIFKPSNPGEKQRMTNRKQRGWNRSERKLQIVRWRGRK
jgi:hypothetical protein